MLNNEASDLSDVFASDLARTEHWCIGNNSGFHDQNPSYGI